MDDTVKLNSLAAHSDDNLRSMIASIRAELQMRYVRSLSDAGPYPERYSPAAVFDELNREMLQLRARRDPASPAEAKHLYPITQIDYSGDDYPRAGCKVVIDLSERDYVWRAYAPGVLVESGGALEYYAPRPLASIGIAIDAFAHGVRRRSVLVQMCRAEREEAANRQNQDPSLPGKAR